MTTRRDYDDITKSMNANDDKVEGTSAQSHNSSKSNVKSNPSLRRSSRLSAKIVSSSTNTTSPLIKQDIETRSTSKKHQGINTKTSSTSNKRKQESLNVSTARKSSSNRPTKKLKAVTPSPAAFAATASISIFAFDETPEKRKDESGSSPPTTNQTTASFRLEPLPEGVVDIYKFDDTNKCTTAAFSPIRKSSCKKVKTRRNSSSKSMNIPFYCNNCNGNTKSCSGEALTAEYFRVYGKEYWNNLHERERPVITTDIVEESDLKWTGNSNIGDGDDDDDNDAVPSPIVSSFSQRVCQTPPRRRQFVDKKVWDRVKSAGSNSLFHQDEPEESTRFLIKLHQHELTPKMRSVLIDWMIELSDHFNFSQSTLHLAITLVDRFLQSGPSSTIKEKSLNSTYRYHPDHGHVSSQSDDDDDDDDCLHGDAATHNHRYVVTRNEFQLLGVTCVWVACKLQEITVPKIDQIAYVSDHIYNFEEIKMMERRMCNALNFTFYDAPTPHQFLLEFLRASHEGDHGYCIDNKTDPMIGRCSHCHCGIEPTTDSVLADLANYLLELGRMSYFSVTRKPSLLAAAAVYCARVTLGIRSNDRKCDDEGYWTRTLQYYSGYTKSDIDEAVMTIHRYHVAAEQSTLKAAFGKYKSKKYRRVALKTVRTTKDICQKLLSKIQS